VNGGLEALLEGGGMELGGGLLLDEETAATPASGRPGRHTPAARSQCWWDPQSLVDLHTDGRTHAPRLAAASSAASVRLLESNTTDSPGNRTRPGEFHPLRGGPL
jgi:hypothetical protein